MCYWKEELVPKAEIGADALCKIFWRVVRIVDVPLEFVFINDTPDAHIYGDDADLL